MQNSSRLSSKRGSLCVALFERAHIASGLVSPSSAPLVAISLSFPGKMLQRRIHNSSKLRPVRAFCVPASFEKPKTVEGAPAAALISNPRREAFADVRRCLVFFFFLPFSYIHNDLARQAVRVPCTAYSCSSRRWMGLGLSSRGCVRPIIRVPLLHIDRNPIDDSTCAWYARSNEYFASRTLI